MSETLTITLAGNDYTVRRLTLRQARALGIGVLRDNPQTPEAGFASSVDQSIEILVAALSRDHPGVTADSLLDMELDVRGVRAAADAVLFFAGYLKKSDEATSGEAQPGAA